MNKLFALVSGLLISSTALSQAQTSVTTEPVGFLKVTLPAAPGVGLSTVTPAAFPLARNPVDVGIITSVGSNTITSSGATWGTLSSTAAPHFIKISSGPAASPTQGVGRFFKISSNTSTVLTLENDGVNLSTVILPDSRYQIFPAHTFASLFGSTTTSLLSGTPADADLIRIYRIVAPSTTPAWVTFWHNGTEWRRIGSALSQNDTLVYPDEGMLLVRRGLSPITLSFVGCAPTTTEQTQIPGPDVTPLANRFPVDLTLGSLGLENLEGWKKDLSPSVADNVRIFDGATWLSYWYSPGNGGTVVPGWKRIGASGDQAAVKISAGSSILVVRQSSSLGKNDILTQSLPY
jgi:uncharacterized protein (TIGR02597 family)